MQVIIRPFDQVPQFSGKDIAYATEDPRLRPFYQYPVSIDQFPRIIQDKDYPVAQRKTLVQALRKQYEAFSTSPEVKNNLEALGKENTYTVITAHQPALFTGPLYYIYKIASAIRLCRDLNTKYPDYHFVPVFISGSEDHDFEEINHAQLFGKQITWENDESGACGLMKTSSLGPALEALKDILGDSERAQEAYQMMEEAHTQHELYGTSAQHLVNHLFQSYGLVVANMNDRELKRLFIPQMEIELFEMPSHTLIRETQEKLEQIDFGDQAHAREINLFYLRDQLRARIEKEGDHFVVVDTDYRFSAEAMKEELHQHPERFSPNVVMRPIYQEVVFPNLAYIGGGGELAYWLERKTQFAHFGINFPMLIRRNSALWIDKGSSKRMDKLELSIDDLFRDTEELRQDFVRKNTENQINLNPEKEALEKILVEVSRKAKEVDPSLEKRVLSENAKITKSLENLETRLMRAEKQRFDVSLNQIQSLKEKLFPGNGLQERYDNFLPLYLRRGPELFDLLIEHLDPMQRGMVIFRE